MARGSTATYGNVTFERVKEKPFTARDLTVGDYFVYEPDGIHIHISNGWMDGVLRATDLRSGSSQAISRLDLPVYVVRPTITF